MRKSSNLSYMVKDSDVRANHSFYVDIRCLGEDNQVRASNLEAMHWHDYFELEIIFDGEGVHHLNDAYYDVYKGSAYIVTPIDFHSVHFNKDKAGRVLHIQFDSFIMSDGVTDLITSAKTPISVVFDSEELELVRVLGNRLLEEYNSENFGKWLMIRSILEQLCMLVLRKIDRISDEPKMNVYDETILQVVNYLNYNFRNKVSLSSVSERFILNPNYLGEKFKNTMGISFSSYVNDLRLSYALNLLKNSEFSIKQISKESGFSSVSYFIKQFSEKYGNAPQRMRSNSDNNLHI